MSLLCQVINYRCARFVFVMILLQDSKTTQLNVVITAQSALKLFPVRFQTYKWRRDT